MFALLLVLVILEALLVLRLVAKLRARKYDGNLLVNDTDVKTTLALALDTLPEDLPKKKYVMLKVVNESEE